MPSTAEHVTKADGNATLALSLNLDNQPKIDWALIMLFYAAMHYVEAYLAKSNTHLTSHLTRDKHIGRMSDLKKIFMEYADLKYFGFNARYACNAFKPSDVTDVAVKDFEKIKNHLAPLL